MQPNSITINATNQQNFNSSLSRAIVNQDVENWTPECIKTFFSFSFNFNEAESCDFLNEWKYLSEKNITLIELLYEANFEQCQKGESLRFSYLAYTIDMLRKYTLEHSKVNCKDSYDFDSHFKKFSGGSLLSQWSKEKVYYFLNKTFVFESSEEKFQDVAEAFLEKGFSGKNVEECNLGNLQSNYNLKIPMQRVDLLKKVIINLQLSGDTFKTGKQPKAPKIIPLKYQFPLAEPITHTIKIGFTIQSDQSGSTKRPSQADYPQATRQRTSQAVNNQTILLPQPKIPTPTPTPAPQAFRADPKPIPHPTVQVPTSKLNPELRLESNSYLLPRLREGCYPFTAWISSNKMFKLALTYWHDQPFFRANGIHFESMTKQDLYEFFLCATFKKNVNKNDPQYSFQSEAAEFYKHGYDGLKILNTPLAEIYEDCNLKYDYKATILESILILMRDDGIN